MKIKTLALALALGAPVCLLTAQDDPAGPVGPGRPPRGGFHVLPPLAYAELGLTPDQQKQIADIESQLKAQMEKLLTLAQLQQLKQMRPPQRPGGPGDPVGGDEPGAAAGGPEAPGGPGGHPPKNPFIAALDLNGDGVIDASELAQAAASLKALDKNGDGQLTPDEIRPPRPAGPGGRGGAEGRRPQPPGAGGRERPQRPPPE